MEHRSRTKLATVLVLGVVFGSGMLLGYAADGTRAAAAEVTGAEARRDAPDRPADGQQRRRVYEQMNPTPAQMVLIDSIVGMHRERMNLLHADFEHAQKVYRESYDAVIQDTRDDITKVFPAAQQAEYRRLLAEFDRQRELERQAEAARQ